MSDDAAKIQDFHDFASKKLSEIAAVLTDDARITLVARFPGHRDRDLVVTNDEIEEAITALICSAGRSRTKG